MKTLLVRTLGKDGCDLMRGVLPVRYCADELMQNGIQLKLTTDILRTDNPDGVMVHRIIKERGVVELARLKHRGAKIFWDTDDACDLVPAWSPVVYSEDDIVCYEAAQAIASYRSASTSVLASLVGALDNVLPNLMDPAWFQFPESQIDPNRAIQVLWFGSVTHRGDLEMIEPAIRRVLEDCVPGKVKFTFWGDALPGLIKDYMGRGVQSLAPSNISDFHRRLVGLAPDIVLCPLAPHPFNDCKSNLKWMEAGLSRACPIVSRCAAYSCVEEGETAIVADTPESWYDCLREMIDDDEGRRKVAAQCRDEVSFSWAWSSERRGKWLSYFSSV